ncbi:hypothetical protein INS49_012530 [Diaporthe citri]|uniref:uncharacterized protein n=1 Tax=Diaporthe citri TaxID=83186 RepID=UPI001C7E5703|nr:uncharacterized protein INS49_012530 [Diaporthe citri]KAG6359010.1 hypothetical protein INS49_012530 [Diaporthe citri]
MSQYVRNDYISVTSAEQGSTSDDQNDKSSSPYPRHLVSRRALAAAVRQLNVVGPASRVLAAGPQVPGDAVSCFDFFRFRVRAVTPTAGHDLLGDTPGFWDRTLLQTAHVEPAVWHAVAALGALQRKWEVVSRLSQVSFATPEAGSNGSEHVIGESAGNIDNGDEATTELESSSMQLASQASTSYIQALKMASTMTDINAILVLSIALAAASNLTGKWIDSQVHIRAATKLVGQLADDARGKPVSELDINDAADSLARLDLQWLTFQDSQAPYPYLESQLLAHALRRAPEIKSLAHAQDLLMGIMRKLWVGAGLADTEQPGTDITGQSDIDIIADLAEWEHKTLQLLSSAHTPAKQASPSLLFLKICHATVHLIILAGITQSSYNELCWDNHLAHFERMIALSALFIQAEVYRNPLLPSVVSLDGPGIIMSLWLVAFRCRHPLLRRRALGLLRVSRRQEGMWMSTSAAVVAQKLIEIEEAGMHGTKAFSDSVLVPAFCTLEPVTAFEQVLIKQFEAEDLDPQSWLLGAGLWTARTKWDMPGRALIPLERRIADVTTFAQPYDPRKGRSKADVTLSFADYDMSRELRQEIISVNF